MVCSLASILYFDLPSPGHTPAEGKGSMMLIGCSLRAGSEPGVYSFLVISPGWRAEAADAIAAGTNVSYKLTADSNVKLKDHVGDKVEVTGTAAKGEAGTSHSSADKARVEWRSSK